MKNGDAPTSPRTGELGELQLAVLNVLWTCGQATDVDPNQHSAQAGRVLGRAGVAVFPEPRIQHAVRPKRDGERL